LKTYPYLLCRQGTYYFRRTTPKDLLYFIGQKEIIKTLGTSDIRTARKAALEMSEQLEELFEKIRNGKKLLSAEEVASVASEYTRLKLKSSCTTRWRISQTGATKMRNGRLFMRGSTESKRLSNASATRNVQFVLFKQRCRSPWSDVNSV